MSEPSSSVAPVGRLAPSPTGRLHLGHARSFLLAWWSIRSRGGSILLRLEDLDRGRIRPGMAEGVLRDLEWLGIDWDGEPVSQSERLDRYRGAVAELEATDRVYACVCTRREIRLAASAPHLDDGTQAYPGTCRGRFSDAATAERRTGRAPALRFRVEPGPVTVIDKILGERSFDIAAEVGDFPLWTRDGIPSYQLAVVVDDAAQGVTEVLRGDDLLSSAARQSLLQEALGYPCPEWVHVPLVTDREGRRLASRSGDLALAELREAGVDPRSIVGWIARASGFDVDDRVDAAAAVPAFRLDRLTRAPLAIPPDLVARLTG